VCVCVCVWSSVLAAALAPRAFLQSVYVCAWEREHEREKDRGPMRVCVCLRVCERERDRECVCVRVCACVRDLLR